MHLLEDFVNVDGVALSPPPSLLLVPSTLGFCLGGSLLGSFACWFGWHVDSARSELQMMMAKGLASYLYSKACRFVARFASAEKATKRHMCCFSPPNEMVDTNAV